MRFLGATSAGVTDPVFDKDLSFYLLVLPLYDDIVDIIMTIFSLMIVLWLTLGMVLRPGTTALIHGVDQGGVFILTCVALLNTFRPKLDGRVNNVDSSLANVECLCRTSRQKALPHSPFGMFLG